MIVPGKILVVDNRETDVDNIIKFFRDKNECVIFRKDAPPEDRCPVNVRLIILDLDLDGCGSVTDADISNVTLVLKRISTRTKFFMVVLWSNYIEEDDDEDWAGKIKTEYKVQTGEDFPALFIKPFAKKVGGRKLVDGIKKLIEENPHAGVVFGWEKSVNSAKDKVVSDIMNAGGIQTILKTIEKETGKDAAPREVFTLFNRLLLRYSIQEKNQIIKSVAQILKKRETLENICKWYSRIHYLQAYFPVKKEPVWTGDIYKTNRKSSEEEYAIVITPACDFAQKKVQNIKVIYGLKFGDQIPDYRADQEENIPLVVKKLDKKRNGNYKPKADVINILTSGHGLSDRLYLLHFLRDKPENDDYFHILIDFSKSGFIRANIDDNKIIKKPDKWKRICRLDHPWTDDFQQKYSSYTNRIGTPDFPKNIISDEKKKLEGTSDT